MNKSYSHVYSDLGKMINNAKFAGRNKYKYTILEARLNNGFKYCCILYVNPLFYVKKYIIILWLK